MPQGRRRPNPTQRRCQGLVHAARADLWCALGRADLWCALALLAWGAAGCSSRPTGPPEVRQSTEGTQSSAPAPLPEPPVAPGLRPPSTRLPNVEVNGARFARERIVLALRATGGMPLPGETRDLQSAVVLVWDDGRVLWSANRLNGGPPYRMGMVPRSNVIAVQRSVTSDADATDAVLRQESLGPDHPFATLFLVLGGGRYAQMSSWHDRGPDPTMLATSRGLVAREGRDPSAVLAADTREYQTFRRVWSKIEARLWWLVDAAAAGSSSVSATTDWDWVDFARR
jgi:hypothetical protein